MFSKYANQNQMLSLEDKKDSSTLCQVREVCEVWHFLTDEHEGIVEFFLYSNWNFLKGSDLSV